LLDAYRHCDGVWEDQEEKVAIKDVMDELLTNDNVGEADKGDRRPQCQPLQAMRRRRRRNEKERGAEADKKKPRRGTRGLRCVRSHHAGARVRFSSVGTPEAIEGVLAFP